MKAGSIDADALRAMLNSDEAPLVIDVREPAEFNQDHIDGAKNIPLTELSTGLAAAPMNEMIVFVCQSGVRSLQAATFAASIGYGEANNLEGGMNAFRDNDTGDDDTGDDAGGGKDAVSRDDVK